MPTVSPTPPAEPLPPDLKVAIVHYWLLNMRGGEKVVEALVEMFPQADLYTHVCRPQALSPLLRQRPIRTTFIQKLPFAARLYQKYLPLMPLALEQLDLRDYDLVISSESGPAKGVLTSPDSLHLCYCHTPMRYLWDMYPDYLAQVRPWLRLLMVPLVHYLRLWDVSTALRVDRFVANSAFVARRIDKIYRRPATVIHPPVAVEQFEPGQGPGEFYLMVGQLVGYKRTDLAIRAFNRLGRRLVIIGSGEQYRQLAALAGPNVQLLGHQPFQVIRDHYSRCRALIFPGQEDFGIVPVEAMASGRPVIAYGRGGIRDSVLDGQTGLFFHRQDEDCLIEAVHRFEALESTFSAQAIAGHARQFAKDRFKAQMAGLIGQCLADRADRPLP